MNLPINERETWEWAVKRAVQEIGRRQIKFGKALNSPSDYRTQEQQKEEVVKVGEMTPRQSLEWLALIAGSIEPGDPSNLLPRMIRIVENHLP